MADVLNPQVVDGVTSANFKAVAEQIAVLSNAALQDALQDQRDSRLLSRSILGSLCKRIVETDVQEAVALSKNATADLPNREVELGSSTAIAQQLQVTMAALAQILSKLAQTTPPETGVGPAK